MKLKVVQLETDWMTNLKRPELGKEWAIIDEDHNDCPVVCVAVTAISDYPMEALEDILTVMCERFNVFEPSEKVKLIFEH